MKNQPPVAGCFAKYLSHIAQEIGDSDLVRLYRGKRNPLEGVQNISNNKMTRHEL